MSSKVIREMSIGAAELVETLFARDGVAKAMGLELLDSGEGRATVALDIREDHLNFNGTCHGGIIFSVADMAFGLAANSHGVVAPAINASIINHASAGDSDRLTASATETSRSKRMASYLVNVVLGDGRKVATFTASVFVTNKPHDAAADAASGS